MKPLRMLVTVRPDVFPELWCQLEKLSPRVRARVLLNLATRGPQYIMATSDAFPAKTHGPTTGKHREHSGHLPATVTCIVSEALLEFEQK